MSQTNYTPISLYYSSTASASPSPANLVNGELAINITDGKLFYKDNAGAVQTLATKAATSGTFGAISVTSETNSGTLTLSGGTANGLAYLNGSKVLTTGSALTFDGTNFGVTNGAITAGGSNIVLTGRGSSSFPTAGAGYFQLRTNNADGTSGGLDVYTDNAGTLRQSYRIYEDPVAGACYQAWNTAGSEQMRLTSTGLGIGTSSPAYKLDVYGSSGNMAQLYQNDGTYNRRLITTIAATGANLGVTLNATSSVGNDNLIFQVSSVERMRLDTAGNLGLGVTPSAWGTAKAIELTGGSLSTYTTNQMYLNQNAYYNGANWIYKTSGFGAAQYWQFQGSHNWNIAPSGTAGNAITFTQAMTLDASGNLLVGTTSNLASNGVIIYPAAGGYSSAGMGHASGTASGSAYWTWYYNGGIIGSITQTGTAAVLYNTTSDYRLKDVVGAVSGQGERIDALEPIEYIWKADGTHTRGFLAHKFQEVYAGSVNGTKDAVDEEGKPVYQSMQASSSEVIADLVAEIQSLRKRLAAAGI